MSTRLILQSPLKPTEILTSLEALAAPETTELRIAVAYATKTGCDELLPRLRARTGSRRWRTIPKAAVVSTDFHITEPAALADLQSHGFDVRLSDTPRSSFHPKLYAFGSGLAVEALVGSANLTRAAMTINTEAATVGRLPRGFASTWAELLSLATPLTAEVLERYVKQRRKAPPPIRPDPLPPRPRPLRPQSNFPDAVFAGIVRPAVFDALWVEAGSMSSSGSHAQLELPRGAHRFFSFNFNKYDKQHHVIGVVVLFSGGKTWADRKITWHGKNNSMERINLPTVHRGGVDYLDTAVLFKRQGQRFQLVVAPWNSAIAAAWRAASREAGQVYKLGQKGSRICGLF